MSLIVVVGVVPHWSLSQFIFSMPPYKQSATNNPSAGILQRDLTAGSSHEQYVQELHCVQMFLQSSRLHDRTSFSVWSHNPVQDLLRRRFFLSGNGGIRAILTKPDV